MGNADFFLPAGIYKFRVDSDNTQYWTDPVPLAALQENTLNLDLDLMAANLTADPTYARYDGVAPEKKIFYLASSEPGILDTNGADTGHAAYYFINDHLGSPVKVVDGQGQTVWSAEFTPFGNAQNILGTYENRFRFPGQYHDSETGLHYNWHRYYDPDTGRYLTPDPIGLAGGINPFVYSLNNPINFIDPLGLMTYGEGFSLSLSLFGGNGSISFLTVEDDRGNFGIAISTTEGGAAEVIGGSAQWVFNSTTTAETIDALNGTSGVVSSGGGFVVGGNFEVEYGPSYIGHSEMFGLDLGLVPFNWTGGASQTKVYNFKRILDDVLNLFFDGDECQ